MVPHVPKLIPSEVTLKQSFFFAAPVLTACSSSDPDFEKCVKAVVERIRPAIAAGNYGEGQPKAPPLEPISIDQMAIDRGAGFRCKLSDVKIAGAGDFTMRRVK